MKHYILVSLSIIQLFHSFTVATSAMYPTNKLSFHTNPNPFQLSTVSSSSSLSSSLSIPTYDLSYINGIEYTPALAPGNSLWWYNWSDYAEEIDKELNGAVKHFQFNHLRMFLHNMVYDVDNGVTLFSAMEGFLTIANKYNMTSSFAFFDDCWNHNDANLTNPCVPVPGKHNGCWFACPQDSQRTNVTNFHDYVYNTVAHFANDKRIAFWEIFNEPNNSPFSLQLRDAAYNWTVTALMNNQATIPVLSCWDDNQDSMVVDMHRYDTNFVGWSSQIFQNTNKGGLITEGGCRWYPTYDDSGSPLMILHWYNILKSITPSTAAPFKFGIITSWELAVGNSNTRWHWSTPDNTPEPVIPWCGHMFPDNTPVSYTEAAALRNSTTGKNDFLAFDKFLPSNNYQLTEDNYLCLYQNQSYTITLLPNSPPGDLTNILIETTIWLNTTIGGGILFRANTNNNQLTGYFAGFRSFYSSLLTLELWTENQSPQILASFNMSTLNCGLSSNGWNMLRVVVQGNMFAIYANPMYLDAIQPEGILPRLTYIDNTFTDGTVMLVAANDNTVTNECTRFDYIGVLPASVL